MPRGRNRNSFGGRPARRFGVQARRSRQDIGAAARDHAEVGDTGNFDRFLRTRERQEVEGTGAGLGGGGVYGRPLGRKLRAPEGGELPPGAEVDSGPVTVMGGVAEGPLVGGNLALLAATCGTPDRLSTGRSGLSALHLCPFQ